MTITPDYSQYTFFELTDALEHINQQKYPERTQLILAELALLEARFPCIRVPVNGLIEKKPPDGLWQKFKAFFEEDTSAKTYGHIEAEIRKKHAEPEEEPYFPISIISAVLEDNHGTLDFVLESEHDAIRINAVNITRLRVILEKAEKDLGC
ncbi:MAG: hypothetical protein ACI8WB_001803 [Phenylobacterium sp.]|jgi:hypothetical protein